MATPWKPEGYTSVFRRHDVVGQLAGRPMTATDRRVKRLGAVTGLVVLMAAWQPALAPTDETARIRAHLEGVELRMIASPPDGLTPAQQAARAETLAWLAEYRRRGLFPHNHVRPGEGVPIFVDPHGTPCAVGYLLLRSGQDDLVEEIVRTDNLIRVPVLAGNPVLSDWLDERGITLEEAAAIQPAYQGGDLSTGVETGSTYADLSVGGAVLSAAVTSYVLATSPRPDGWDATRLLGAASLGFHGSMVAYSVASDTDEPNWTIGLNVVGAFLSGFGLVDQALGAPTDERMTSPVTVRPLVSSRGIGLSLIH